MIDKSGDGRIEPNEINLLTSAELNTIFDGEEPGTVSVNMVCLSFYFLHKLFP